MQRLSASGGQVKNRSTPTASAAPSGTTNACSRPAMVVAVAPPLCQSRVDTVKSVAEMTDRVRSAALTTPITCPAELRCSSASLHATASARASQRRRLIDRWSPQDHNIRTGGRAARRAPARAVPPAETPGPRTRTCGTRRSPHTDPRRRGDPAAARRRTPGPRTPAGAGPHPPTRGPPGTRAGPTRAPAPPRRRGLAHALRNRPRHADPRQHPLAIGANLRQEQVPEDDRVETWHALAQRLQRGAHVSLILVVRGPRRDHHLLEREAERRGLALEQRAAHDVHADAVILSRHRGERSEEHTS